MLLDSHEAMLGDELVGETDTKPCSRPTAETQAKDLNRFLKAIDSYRGSSSDLTGSAAGGPLREPVTHHLVCFRFVVVVVVVFLSRIECKVLSLGR
jgi:hypothetical protein